ncbi:MAG: hypothetical protein ABJG47_19105 [Ekhidna sp.]
MKQDIEKIIDEALKSEPAFMLRKDFKDRVVQIIKKQEKASQKRLYFWMAIGILTIFGFGFATIAYFLPTIFEQFGKMNQSVSGLVPLAVLIGVLVTLVQFLDKRFVKNKLLI